MSENSVRSEEPVKSGMRAAIGAGGIPQFLIDLASR